MHECQRALFNRATSLLTWKCSDFRSLASSIAKGHVPLAYVHPSGRMAPDRSGGLLSRAVLIVIFFLFGYHHIDDLNNGK